MSPAYYNEIDPYCCEWLRNLIAAGHIPNGDVDERCIRDVQADDLRGYGQCHFFAGIGGFAYACRLAGWPDDRPIWTGGFPCQPFSQAGQRQGANDDRHVWPEFIRIIAARRPAQLLFENVAGLIPLALDRVLSDLEDCDYTAQTFVIPACAVDAPHRRDRVWIVADGNSNGRHQISEREADGKCDAEPCGTMGAHFVPCADGKTRRVKPGIRFLAHGVPGRVAKLRALGNAIVPQVAAEIIRAMM